MSNFWCACKKSMPCHSEERSDEESQWYQILRYRSEWQKSVSVTFYGRINIDSFVKSRIFPPLVGGDITNWNSAVFTLTPTISHQGRGSFSTFYGRINIDVFVKSQKLTNLSFPRKRESSNYEQLWIPDQVGNDKTTEIRAFKEVILIKVA